ncbi:beta-L-arabinofuranosidase domain-containing protein [Lachnospiraceae bacterium 29-84]
MARRTKRWCSFILSLALAVSGIAAVKPGVAVQAEGRNGILVGVEEASAVGDERAAADTADMQGTDTEHLEYAKAVNFTNVKIDDAFWGNRQKQFICQVIPTAIARVEEGSGGIPNIKNAALMHRGETHGNFSGAYYVDSDVHKILESMCYALMIDPQGDAQTAAGQEAIRAKLEEWIPYYVDAQEEDGYFDTYFTLSSFGGASTGRYTDFNLHELYCAGHFYEAAVAHYKATGGEDTRLLDVAVKNADHIASLFGVGKWKQVPGHQEIELALVKLADLCEEIGGDYAGKAGSYRELAKFFLDTRGDLEDRHGTNVNNFHTQDHLPVTEQLTAVGHAVRAFYLYSGMVDVAMASGTHDYDRALLSLWDDVAKTKTYVTGGVGAVASREGFGEPYELPNDVAYNETCASIGNMMWNERMGRYFDNSKYADEMERALYNGIISCVNLDGDKFFYGNPMQSNGGSSRSSWFGTACCPSNLVRFVESLGNYIYTQKDGELTVNLYIGNEMTVQMGGASVSWDMATDMPWGGTSSLTYQGDDNTAFTLRLRIPSWAKGQNTISVNGEAVPAQADDKGYVSITRTWNKGDKVGISFAMEVERVYSDERVTTNKGLVAIQRGPIVYAAEELDNEDSVFQYVIPQDAGIRTENIDDITGLSKEYKEVTLDPSAPDAEYHGIADVPVEDVGKEWSVYDPEGKISMVSNDETNKTEFHFGKGTRVKAIYNGEEASEWTDYAVEAKITLTQELNMNAGIIFHADKSTFGNGPDEYNGYFIGIGKDSGGQGVTFGCANTENGWYRFNLVPTREPIQMDREYTLRIVVKEDLFAVYLDNQLVTIQKDPQFRYKKGTVGLRSYQQAFRVRDFSVRSLTQADIPDLQSYYLPTEDTYQIREAVILHADAEVFDPSQWEYLPKTLTMVPYYTWQNRGQGEMTVYLKESKELAEYGNVARYATPNASVVSAFDTIAALNDGTDARWTSYGKALNPWVELAFPWKVTLSGSRVKWYNDGGGVQIPDGLTIEYWDTETEEYVPVTQKGEYNTFKAGEFNTYEFETVETTKLRMHIKNDVKRIASGIMEWEVIGSISPVSICFEEESMGLGIGESRLLAATVKPSVSDIALTWTSNRPEVATVEDGLVTAVSAGEAVITVETANKLKASCTVMVVDTSDLEAAVKAAAEAAAAAKAEAQKALDEAKKAEEAKKQALAQLEEAKEQVKAAQDEVQKAKAAEGLAKAQAEAAKAEAKAAKEQAEAAKAQAEEAKAQNELAKAQVELAKGEAQAAKDAAEEAKAAKALADAEAKAAKAEAAAAKAESEAAKAEAEAARAEARAAKAESEAAKAAAEAAREQAAEASKVYKVTFDSAGGSRIAARTVSKGTTVMEPDSPSRKNYLFAGWYVGAKKYNFETAVSRNLTLTAKWKKVTVKTAVVSKVKNKAVRKAVVTAKKTAGAKGYQFSYTTDKKFKKAVRASSSKSNQLTLRNLKKGKTYYFKVRAYSYDSKNNKVYGKYSAVKKIKIKK